jgi:hypothetical protein
MNAQRSVTPEKRGGWCRKNNKNDEQKKPAEEAGKGYVNNNRKRQGR